MGWKRNRPAEDAPTPPEPVVNGFFRGREQLISGWVLDLEDWKRKREVEIFVGGKPIGTARGDRYDAMVQSHHGGDGNYAFAIYYDGDLDGPVEAVVVDKESGTELRSKQPLVSRSARAGRPLSIDRLKIGSDVEITGRIGAYPWTNDVSLELWSGGKRAISALPVIGVNESEGSFSAKLPPEALRVLLGGNSEVALPGLKEAGLAVAFETSPLLAILSQGDGKLRVELRGEFDQTGPIPATLRIRHDRNALVQEDVRMTSRVATIDSPSGYRLQDGSIEVLVGGSAVPLRIEWPLLEDPQFRHAGGESSPWSVSPNAEIEQGFFAFPSSLANEHQLSGDTALLSRTSEAGPLQLRQRIREVPAGSKELELTAFVRATKGAKIVARLSADDGIQSEVSTASRSSADWTLLRVTHKNDRKISGNLVFELEATGSGVDWLEVALAASRQPPKERGERFGSNLLVNPGLCDWPDGIGVREHSRMGEPCRGWRIINRRTISRMLSRAIMHPEDGSVGLAVAADKVGDYLRLQADFSFKQPVGDPLVLRFRAGIPPAARHLLADSADPLPEFAVIDRAYIIRRTRVTRDNSFADSDEVVATFARKLPIRYEIESFSFAVPAIEACSPNPNADEQVEVTYHLAFDFRGPTAIALFDVEVVVDEAVDRDTETVPLKVEDRNIELQIDMLETLAHWRGQVPVRLGGIAHERRPEPLKWSDGHSREPVTIVIPVFNALAETLACLESLNGSTTVPMLVRLIDDGSDQPVREALEEYSRDKPWVQVHSFDRNRGYTFASDYGIRQARTEWVVLLNSDTVVTRGWLERMLDCARSNPRIAFVGPLSNAASYQSVPKLYDASKKWKTNTLPPGVSPEDMADIVRRSSSREYPEVPILNGFCTLMNRQAFLEVGGLNPTAFPIGYGEENDLCFRAAKAGFKLAVADDVYVYHVKSASFGGARRKELSKAGDAALRKLHPDVDINALTARLRETPALVAIRHAVATELTRVHSAVEDQPANISKTGAACNECHADPDPQLQKA